MFMRIQDLAAWLRHHARLGPAGYLATAVVLAAASLWAFAEAMTGIIRMADLIQPRTQAAAPAIAGIASTAGGIGRDRQGRTPAASPEEEASQRPAVQAPRTVNNPADDQMALYVDGSDGDTYRTVCVRLCDGYFWPISFATHRSSLVHDREQCEKSCGSPVRLYIHRVPGGSTDDMQDLAGAPYSRLKTAFRFRTSFDAACKCTAHPWEQEAKDRHRVFALESDVRKGDKQAVAALATLRGKVEADKRNEQQQKRIANAQLVASGVVSALSATAAGPPPSGRARTVYSYSSAAQRAARLDEDANPMRLGVSESANFFGGRGQGGGFGPLGSGMGGDSTGGGRGASPGFSGGIAGGNSGSSGRRGSRFGGGFSDGGSDWRARAFGGPQ